MENMTHAYFYFLIFFTAALLAGLVALKIAARLTGSVFRKRSAAKIENDGYAGGFHILSDGAGRFPARFAFIALLFVLFNAEFLLLLPWAMSLNLSGGTEVVTALTVVGLWGVGYFYEYKKGALEWE